MSENPVDRSAMSKLVQSHLAALTLLKTRANCRCWRKELVYFAGLRRMQRGGLGSEFWLFHSLTVARAEDGKAFIATDFERMVGK